MLGNPRQRHTDVSPADEQTSVKSVSMLSAASGAYCGPQSFAHGYAVQRKHVLI